MTADEVTSVTCNTCGVAVTEDDGYTTSYGDPVCRDCVRVCERCDDTMASGDSYGWIRGDDLWCSDCLDAHAAWCDNCEQWHLDGSMYLEDRSGSYCEYCVSDAYYCDDCDAYYADGCDSGHGDDDYSNGTRLIHDYSYRPDAIFYSTKPEDRLFFGIEIETEARGGNYETRRDAAEYAHRLEDSELAYLKNDGSLNCGFEVVTHPMTHDYYMQEATELWDTLEGLRTTYNMRSWGTSTCGLHIHISRTGFNGGGHMHRFLNLVYSNQDFYENLAGRGSDQWAKFTDVNKPYLVKDDDGETRWRNDRKQFANKILHGENTDRYSAVNTQNRHTLEMRIFKGTLNSGKIKSQINLAHASVEYTRTLTVADVKGGALNAPRFAQYIMDNAELYPELAMRVDKQYLRQLLVGLARQNGE